MEDEEIRQILRSRAGTHDTRADSRSVIARAHRVKARRAWTIGIVSAVFIASASALAIQISEPDRPQERAGPRPAGAPVASPPAPSETASPERCPRAPVVPTYLPWLARGEEPPEPAFSYDADLDRAQESWQDPGVAPGEGGIGLTRYALPAGLGGGEPLGTEIEGEPGYVHVGEGDSVSASWDLPHRCNLVELTIVDPGTSVEKQIEELRKVAQSFRRR